MVVRKKIRSEAESGDTVDLASRLKRVREGISQLPEEETMTTEGSNTEASNTPKSTGPRKKIPAKSAKKATSPKANGAAKKAEGGTTLATIAKKLKMEPRKARRILRNADGVPEAGARWTWTKDAEVAKVEKILRDATSEK